MVRRFQVIHWTGVGSCVLGGVLYLVSYAQANKARCINSAIKIGKLSDLKLLLDLVPVLIAVTGRAWADRPLVPELSHKEAVITREKEEAQGMKKVTTVFDTLTWTRDDHTVRNVTSETTWCLQDRSGLNLWVVDGIHAEGLPLTLAGEFFEPEKRTAWQTVADELAGYRHLGRRHSEFILPVSTALTAVGELTQLEGGKLGIRAPQKGGPYIITTASLPEVISNLNQASQALRFLAIGFGALGVALIAGRVIKRGATFYRQRRLRRQIEEHVRLRGPAAAGDDGDGGGADGDRNDNLCVVCIERSSECVFSPCGHMCVCEQCGSNLNQCPICRNRSKPIRVYRT